MFWLTQLEVDSIERKHYDEILRCSIRESREICLVLCYNKKNVQSLRVSWLACRPISVSNDY